MLIFQLWGRLLKLNLSYSCWWCLHHIFKFYLILLHSFHIFLLCYWRGMMVIFIKVSYDASHRTRYLDYFWIPFYWRTTIAWFVLIYFTSIYEKVCCTIVLISSDLVPENLYEGNTCLNVCGKFIITKGKCLCFNKCIPVDVSGWHLKGIPRFHQYQVNVEWYTSFGTILHHSGLIGSVVIWIQFLIGIIIIRLVITRF